jgi:hypothetical protein
LDDAYSIICFVFDMHIIMHNERMNRLMDDDADYGRIAASCVRAVRSDHELSGHQGAHHSDISVSSTVQ